MGDKWPVLDYGTDDSPKKLPLFARPAIGILAALTTLIAAIFLVGGLMDAIEGLGIIHLFTGMGCAVISYLLWQPTGLSLWPHPTQKRH